MDHSSNGYATTILTADGRYFDFNSPDPDVVTLHAIARGLANTCRFAGQCAKFYSVAEHSVWVSSIVPPEFAIQGLLHDAAEAFMCDIPKPLKVMLPDYQRFEQLAEAVIFPKFGFTGLDECIKQADKAMLKAEQGQLMNNHHLWTYTADAEPVSVQIECLAPEEAFVLFMERARSLGIYA